MALAKLDREAARQLYGAATLGFAHLHDGARAALLDLAIPQGFIPEEPAGWVSAGSVTNDHL